MDKRRESAALIGDDLAVVLARAAALYEDPATQAKLAADEARAAARAATDEAERKRNQSAEQRAYLRGIGVPELVCDTVMAGPRLTRAMALLSRVSARRPILVLSGGNGCGKTVAAASFALARMPGSRFVTAEKLGRLRTGWRDDREMLEAIETCKALVLDELGEEEGDLCRRFRHLLAERAGNRLATVVTTNLTRDQFRKRYEEPTTNDSRLWSRLHESGHYEEISDPDMRIENRQKKAPQGA